MSTTHFTARLILTTCLFLSPAYADISWIHDETIAEEEIPLVQSRRGLNSPKTAKQTPDVKQLSEAFGHFIGRDIGKQGIQLSIEDVITGIREGAKGKAPPLTEQEYDKITTNLRSQQFNELSTFNLALADAFMVSNAKRHDIVQVTPKRIQYVVLQRGQGRKIDAHTVPTLRFTARFIDGTLFTQTENNQALPVPLDDMIPGFRQGVIGMQEGEKRRIFIHPEAAYGTSGDLAPNSLLLFEVEAVKTGPDRSRLTPTHQAALQTRQRPQDKWDLSLDDDGQDETDPLANYQPKRNRGLIQPVALVSQGNQPAKHKADSKQQEEDEDEYDTGDGTSESDWDDLQPQTNENPPKSPNSRYNSHPHR